jgi:hypothetical protein
MPISVDKSLASQTHTSLYEFATNRECRMLDSSPARHRCYVLPMLTWPIETSTTPIPVRIAQRNLVTGGARAPRVNQKKYGVIGHSSSWTQLDTL